MIPHGFYDMVGKVLEWVNDWYGSAYYSDPGTTSNPAGPTTGTVRVIRGGSFSGNDLNCRVAFRVYSYPDNWYYVSGGFRVSQ